MNAKWWDSPHEFRPERFEKQNFHPYAFLAFSGGPRICLGKNFAMVMGKVILTEFLKKFEVMHTEKPRFV